MENPSNSFDPRELSKDWFETKKFLEDIKPTGYLTLDNNFNEHIRAVLNYRVYEPHCECGETVPTDPGTGGNTKIPTAVSFIAKSLPTAVSFIAKSVPTAVSFIAEDEGNNLDLPMYTNLSVDSRYSEYVAAYTPYVSQQLSMIVMAGNIYAGVTQGDYVKFGDTTFNKVDVDLAKLYGFDLKGVFSSLLNYRQNAYFALYQMPMEYQYFVDGKFTVGTDYKHKFGGLAFRLMLTDQKTGTEKVLLSNIEYEDTEVILPYADGSTYNEIVRKYRLVTNMDKLDEIILHIDEAIKEQTLIKLSNLDPDVQREELTSEVKTIPYSGVNGFTNDQYIFHIETAIVLASDAKLPTTFEEKNTTAWVVDGNGIRHELYKDILCQLMPYENINGQQYIKPNALTTVKAGAIQFRELILDGESFDRNSTRIIGAKSKLGAEQAKAPQQLTYLIDDEFTQTITLREDIGDDLTRLLDENGKVIGLVSIYNRYSTRTMEFEGGVICLNTNGEFVLESGRLISPDVFGFTNGFANTDSRKITFLETSDKNQKFQQKLQGIELMTCGYLN